MTRSPTKSNERRGSSTGGLTLRSLRTFFLATFGLSWGAGMLYTLFQAKVDAIFGSMGYTNPVFILMVYTPGLVGVFMVWRHYGVSGLGSLFRRFTLWRMPKSWWLLLLVGIPAVYYAAAALRGNLTDFFPFTPWYAVLPALLAMLFIGPIEELGWRGVALPLMQRRFPPLWAALILGLLVAIWHTPSFLLRGTKQSAWDFWPFFFGVVAISVILTAMFNDARGSLLVAFLFHAQLNNPIWPDAQPWDMWLFVAAAVVLVVVKRKSLLDRDHAITAILMPSHELANGGDDGAQAQHDARFPASAAAALLPAPQPAAGALLVASTAVGDRLDDQAVVSGVKGDGHMRSTGVPGRVTHALPDDIVGRTCSSGSPAGSTASSPTALR